VTDRSSQKYIGNSKIENTKRNSNMSMKVMGVNKVSILSFIQGTATPKRREDHYTSKG